MVDLAEMATQFPIKHKILQSSRFQDTSWQKRGFQFDKLEDEPGAWQQQAKLRTTTVANSPRFQTFANENENLSSVFWSRMFRRLSKPTKPAFSEFRSQSNTNSKSTKSTVFRICTSQTHPICSCISSPLFLRKNIYDFFQHDTYLCYGQKVPADEFYISFQPNAEMNTAHHMLLFGCELPYETGKAW